MKKRLQVQKGCRIDKIDVMTSDAFEGEYKNCLLSIQKESHNSFYITVETPGGGHLYDGWWLHGGNKTIKDAVKEALMGAKLI